MMFNLKGHNRPQRACEPRQDRRVVAGSGTNVQNLFPLLHIERSKINCMNDRRAVVDSAFGCKSDEDVLIQKRRVVGGSLNVIAPGIYFPRTGTDKALPWR